MYATEAEQEYHETMVEYRNVFGTENGRKVLAHMLTELGVFDTGYTDAGSVALQDYGKRLLWRCGIWCAENMQDMINCFFKISVKEREDAGTEEGGE